MTPVKKVQPIEEIEFSSNGRELRESYKIKSTTHYEWFKLIDGNRDVKHASKIKKSIEAVGLLICPILVNEKMEIVDGQGRFTACKELKLPVYYVQQKGIGIEEVRKMNAVSSNWKTDDYVHSYTEGEDISDGYIYLENLHKMFPHFGFTFLASVTNSRGDTQSLKNIKNGKFKCSQDEYEYAVKKLTWIAKFVKYVTEIGGNSDYMYRALSFCYENEQIDNDYLLEKFKQNYKGISEIASIKGAIENVQKAYNTHQDKYHEAAFIVSDYERHVLSVKKNNIRKG